MKEPSEEDQYWFDRLDAASAKDHDDRTQQEAIDYFREKADPPDFLLKTEAEFFPGEAIHIPKSMWENILRVLEKWIGREPVVRHFLEHLADPNWPGYGFAFETLLVQGEKILPLVDETIEDNQGDPGMVEELEYLREELTGQS